MTAPTVPRKRRRRLHPLWILVPLLAVGGAAFVLLPRARTAQNATQATRTDTAQATRGTFRVSVSGPGTLAPLRTLDLKPQVGGTVTLLPRVGDRVVRGQLIARLDPVPLERSVATARFNLQKAQLSLESLRINNTSTQDSTRQSLSSAQSSFESAGRDLETARQNLAAQQRVYAVGGISAQELEGVRNQLEKAQGTHTTARLALTGARNALGVKASSFTQDLQNAQLAVDGARVQLESARTDLGHAKLYAPFTGTVSTVTGQVGGSASSGAALLTLLDASSLELPVQVDETEIGKVALGQRAVLTLDAVEGNFEGEVVRLDPAATVAQNIAYFNATVRVPNPEGTLRPGMTAEGEIIAQEIQGAVQVPQRAVETVRRRTYVKVLAPDGVTEERVLVRVAAQDGSTAALEDGLQGGETVILPTRASSSAGGGAGGGGFPGGTP